MNELIADMARRVISGRELDIAEISALVEAGCRCPYDLMYWANRVRTDRFGSHVGLCAIVSGKLGACGEDCKWCAQSAHYKSKDSCNAKITSLDEIVATYRWAKEQGSCSLGIVNSGRKPTGADIDSLTAAAAKLQLQQSKAAAKNPDSFKLCASLGELTDSQAEQLVEMGFRRYNHNLETSANMFRQLVTTHTYDDRLRTLKIVRRAGMEICCGGLFGLGEKWSDRIQLALTLRDEVCPDVIPLNFLHPIDSTPLGVATPLKPIEILTIIAIFRLIIPDADIKIAGGREHNLRDMQSWIFYAGATSCMIGNYLTTAGRSAEDDLRMISDLGLTLRRP